MTLGFLSYGWGNTAGDFIKRIGIKPAFGQVDKLEAGPAST
jgi:hypothetical protein